MHTCCECYIISPPHSPPHSTWQHNNLPRLYSDQPLTRPSVLLCNSKQHSAHPIGASKPSMVRQSKDAACEKAASATSQCGSCC